MASKMELPISTIWFLVSADASAGADSASVAAPAAGSVRTALSVVSGTGSAAFTSSAAASAPCSTAREGELGGPFRS